MINDALTPVENCARNIAHWQQMLRQMIIAAHADGASLREIATVAGISHEQVRRIVKAEPEPTTDVQGLVEAPWSDKRWLSC